MSKATRFVAAGIVVALSGVLAPAATLASKAASDALPTLTASVSEANAGPTHLARSLVMGESSGQSVAGWTELGRVSTSRADGSGYGELRHLQSIGDRLVVIGSTLDPDEGPSRDVIYQSADGITWTPTVVPGRKPRFTDLASSGEALVLGGFDRVGGKRKARLWTSSDGVRWTRLAAPRQLRRIDQVVSAGGQGTPLVVLGRRNLFAQPDGGEWTFVTKLIDMPIQHGPGGFLAAQFPNRIMLHWGDDLGSLREVPLPRAMGRNEALLADAQLFALDDQWLLVPHVATHPDTIYSSPDGLEWTEIPRPPGILAGAVRWITDIGDAVQAFGAIDGDRGDKGGIWTFVPGEPVGKAATMARSDEFIDAPVEFGSGYAASGLKMGRAWRLTSWQRSAETSQ